jgi:hypothetical protein
MDATMSQPASLVTAESELEIRRPAGHGGSPEIRQRRLRRMPAASPRGVSAL